MITTGDVAQSDVRVVEVHVLQALLQLLDLSPLGLNLLEVFISGMNALWASTSLTEILISFLCRGGRLGGLRIAGSLCPRELVPNELIS